MEATVRELALSARHDLLDALRSGRFSLPELHATKVNRHLASLLVKTDDPPLKVAAHQFVREHSDPRYEHGLDKLLEVAPPNARASWITEPENFRVLLRLYRERDLSANTERREVTGVLLFVRERFGDDARKALLEAARLRPSTRSSWRTRWLDADEIGRLRRAAGDWWNIIGTAIATGLRRQELLNLHVKDVDVDQGTLVVQSGKSQKARRVLPLGGEVLALLRGWAVAEGLEPSDRIFAVTKGALRRAWEQIRDEAGLTDVRFHDLRHTYAVWCAKSGMPLVELQQRLGHATITMTQRYAVYSPPTESVHYNTALEAMGMGVPEGVPTLVPAPRMRKAAP